MVACWNSLHVGATAVRSSAERKLRTLDSSSAGMLASGPGLATRAAPGMHDLLLQYRQVTTTVQMISERTLKQGTFVWYMIDIIVAMSQMAAAPSCSSQSVQSMTQDGYTGVHH